MRLQYVAGLRALGHDVFWIAPFTSTGNRVEDERLIGLFLRRFSRYGLEGRCCVVTVSGQEREASLETSEFFGMTKRRVKEVARSADLLWNFCRSLRPPLLDAFNHRVFVDVDPGETHVWGLSLDMSVRNHHSFLSVGSKLHDKDCPVPTLGVTWHRFRPFVYMPFWPQRPDPGPRAPFTSVTQWTWNHEVVLNGRPIGATKREAYLRYVPYPRLVNRPVELAANLHVRDETGDREVLQASGWRLVDPHRVASTPARYRRYIAYSRAEFLCPKPVFRELTTGWFSDRSVAYLATGRPVLMEDTGISQHLPTGRGLLCFSSMEEAVEATAEIDAHYEVHSRAARELAEEYFDSRRCLNEMLSASAP